MIKGVESFGQINKYTNGEVIFVYCLGYFICHF